MARSSAWRAGGTIAFIVAPDGASGGGMGRVKDYILQAPPGHWAHGLVPTALITRDGGGRGRSMLLVAKAMLAIARARADGSLALVHINFGDRGSAVRKGLIVLGARAIGAPVFLHLHAVQLERELGRLPRWLRATVALPFRAATCVIVLGERWRHWLTRDLAVTRTPIEVLWNGVPVPPATGRRHAAHDRPLTILFLGTLGERKGVSDLIAALAAIPAAAPAWRAVFAGPGDDAPYRALAARCGIADRVTFTGWLEQDTARDAIAGADMLVLPSYEEGLPLVILEALGLGTPVVATPVGAIAEVLTDGEDVLFCTPGDRAGIAAAIGRVLDDPALRQRLCDGGLRTFAATFSIDAFRTRLFDIWRRYAGRADAAS